jgi:hypothetical protein
MIPFIMFSLSRINGTLPYVYMHVYLAYLIQTFYDFGQGVHKLHKDLQLPSGPCSAATPPL